MTSRSAEPMRASRAERLVAFPLQLGRDWTVRFVQLQGFDRAVALAGQAFTALIPLLIVYTALVSRATGRDFADELRRRHTSRRAARARDRCARHVAPAANLLPCRSR